MLVKNLLLSREPLYGLGAWVAGCDPKFLGLTPEQALAWNDDRAGRGLFGLFHADRPSLLLALMRSVVGEFRLALDELHNDSTTVSFTGAYPEAAEEKTCRGKLLDRFAVCPRPETLPEGFRLWWFHSSRKAELDLAARGHRLHKAQQQLRDLQARLHAP